MAQSVSAVGKRAALPKQCWLNAARVRDEAWPSINKILLICAFVRTVPWVNYWDLQVGRLPAWPTGFPG